jgi:glyoxylase-like metal-dependent hydrolase (beta-lactamase superfamily II)
MTSDTPTLPAYEVYAIKYASMPRTRRDNFIPVDPHDGPMPMDFFVWLIKGAERSILVDTGFSAATAKARNRHFDRCPIEALRTLGVAPESVQDVILTHLHYDHAGNLPLLPNARFHVQDGELDYATGRCMCHAALRHAYAVDDVVELVRKVYADRVVFHAGDGRVAPGVELLLVGGHTKGLQAVRVHTARGWVVLASDASHYYENIESQRAFPIVFNVADMLDGHRRLLAVAGSLERLVPGHDPQVLARYPRVEGDAVGTAVLHMAPIR